MKYVYKIVAAIGALAVAPVLFFTDIFYYNISSFAVQILAYLAQLRGNSDISTQSGEAPTGIADTASIYELFDLVSGFDASGEASLADSLGAIYTPVVLFAVVSVMLIVCAIVTAVFAIAAKNNRKVIYSSIVGIGLSVMLSSIFEDIATPVIDGTVNLGTLLDNMWASLLGSIDDLALSTDFWFVPAIFGAVILWTVLYNFTLPENEKRERKLMLGEADDQ